MKKFLLFILLFCVLFLTSCNKTNNNSITVYCYDSFVGDWGPGTTIANNFEKETGIHVDLVSCSGSVQLYSKLLYEGIKCQADAVIGLPDSINIDTSLFVDWNPECKSNLVTYESSCLIPYEYGVYAFIYNSEETETPAPQTLKDLINPVYKDKFIIIDPRTSSVGLGLLKWSYYALGDGFESWWAKVLDNALTVADSWSSAYGLFTEGEAPLVISYTTSPVYHMIYEDTDKYKALAFDEGHINTEEYLAVLKSSKKQKEAKQFCEYVLTEGQKDIAVANTMFPANKKTELPEQYKNLVQTKEIKIDNKAFIDIQDDVLNKWIKVAVK